MREKSNFGDKKTYVNEENVDIDKEEKVSLELSIVKDFVEPLHGFRLLSESNRNDLFEKLFWRTRLKLKFENNLTRSRQNLKLNSESL